MSFESFVGLVLFSMAASITPGPNNLMLMASGVNYGFKRTLPHLLGVSFGFMFLVSLVGLGIMQLFGEYPMVFIGLKTVCAFYLAYLALKIARSHQVTDASETASKPFSFFQAALFQWVNPKSWSMALTSISLYAADHNSLSVFMVVIIFGAVNFPCIVGWTLIGGKIKQWLKSPASLRNFNYTMAVLLMLSLLPLLI